MNTTAIRQRNAVIGALYESSAAYLCDTAYCMLKCRSDAQDAVEETFSKLICRGALPEFRDERGARAFLVTAVKNTCIDMLRKRNSVSSVDLHGY